MSTGIESEPAHPLIPFPQDTTKEEGSPLLESLISTEEGDPASNPGKTSHSHHNLSCTTTDVEVCLLRCREPWTHVVPTNPGLKMSIQTIHPQTGVEGLRNRSFGGCGTVGGAFPLSNAETLVTDVCISVAGDMSSVMKADQLGLCASMAPYIVQDMERTSFSSATTLPIRPRKALPTFDGRF